MLFPIAIILLIIILFYYFSYRFRFSEDRLNTILVNNYLRTNDPPNGTYEVARVRNGHVDGDMIKGTKYTINMLSRAEYDEVVVSMSISKNPNI